MRSKIRKITQIGTKQQQKSCNSLHTDWETSFNIYTGKKKRKKILKSFSGPGFIILLIFIIFLDGFFWGYFAPQKQDKQQ